MGYENGKLPDSALADIPGGRLANDGAAASWLAGPAKAGLRPLGPDSSYRSYDRQVYYWNLYQSGQGNLAAVPGTSNHGWGHAVDLADPSWMREWIIEHGHAYGWYWGEAPSEVWHVTWSGEEWAGRPVFVPLRRGVRNNHARVRRLQKMLRHAGGVLPKPRPGRYWRGRFTGRFGLRTERAVRRFQRDHHLAPDGVVGPRTWATLRRLGRKDVAK